MTDPDMKKAREIVSSVGNPNDLDGLTAAIAAAIKAERDACAEIAREALKEEK